MEGNLDPLSLIAKRHQTDKFGHHNYTPIYNQWLQKWRSEPLVLLEIGVGGYQYPDRGGGSLKMWKEYFERGWVHGVDIYDKSGLDELRIKTHKGSQIDREFLYDMLMKLQKQPRVIIDDGSHINPYTLQTFDILFPKLQDGGLYFIEDAHTSYWEEIAGDGTDFGGGTHPNTVMNYMKIMADTLNEEHSRGRTPIHTSDVYKMIKGISFYREIIVIEKI